MISVNHTEYFDLVGQVVDELLVHLGSELDDFHCVELLAPYLFDQIHSPVSPLSDFPVEQEVLEREVFFLLLVTPDLLVFVDDLRLGNHLSIVKRSFRDRGTLRIVLGVGFVEFHVVKRGLVQQTLTFLGEHFLHLLLGNLLVVAFGSVVGGKADHGFADESQLLVFEELELLELFVLLAEHLDQFDSRGKEFAQLLVEIEDIVVFEALLVFLLENVLEHFLVGKVVVGIGLLHQLIPVFLQLAKEEKGEVATFLAQNLTVSLLPIGALLHTDIEFILAHPHLWEISVYFKRTLAEFVHQGSSLQIAVR